MPQITKILEISNATELKLVEDLKTQIEDCKKYLNENANSEDAKVIPELTAQNNKIHRLDGELTTALLVVAGLRDTAQRVWTIHHQAETRIEGLKQLEKLQTALSEVTIPIRELSHFKDVIDKEIKDKEAAITQHRHSQKTHPEMCSALSDIK